MSTLGKVPHPPRLPSVPTYGDLPLGTEPGVELGDECYVTSERAIYMITSLSPTVWVARPGYKPTMIVVGNANNGDSLLTAQYVDTGDGAALRAAVDEATTSGLPTIILVREGSYTPTAANRLTLPSNVTLMGFGGDRVTISCPDEAGESQNLLVLQSGSKLQNITVTLHGNPAATFTNNEDLYAVFVQDDVEISNVRVSVDNGDGAGPVIGAIGRFDGGTPSGIVIDRVNIETNGGLSFGISIFTTDASVVPTNDNRVELSNIVVQESTTTNSCFAIDLAVIADIRNVHAIGCRALFSSQINLGDGSFDNYFVENCSIQHAGQVTQSQSDLRFKRIAGTSVLNNFRVAGFSVVNDDADMLRVAFEDMTVNGFSLTDFSGSSAVTTNDDLEVVLIGACVMQDPTIANVRTPGKVTTFTQAPSTSPFANMAISNVRADILSIANYAEDTMITNAKLTQLVIGNSALRTLTSSTVKYDNLVNNGSYGMFGTKKTVDSVDPVATDDFNKGFRNGDIWLNESADREWICRDPMVGAAVWMMLLVSPTATPGAMKSFGTDASGTIGFYNPSLFESTGVLSGGALSINADPTKFNIAAALLGFTDYSVTPAQPTRTPVAYAGATAVTATFLATNPATYVGIDSSGTIIQQVTPFTNAQRRTIASLGLLVHTNLTTINATNTILGPLRSGINQLHDFLEYHGPESKGLIYSANGANLNLNRSNGTIFKYGANFHVDPNNPHEVTLGAQVALTFRYRTRNGEVSGDVTAVDPNQYDNAGVLTAVPNNSFTVQRIYVFQSGLQRIQYGQAVYTTLADAISGFASETFVAEANIAANGVFRGWLIVQEDATALNNATQAKFIPASTTGSPSSPGVALASTDDLPQGTTNKYWLRTSFDVSTASQTIDGTYATYRCTHSAAGTVLTLSTANWPIGEIRRVTKENTSANTITFVPPAGGTINGAAADATLVAPGSIRASATNLGDMEWTVQRVASNTWRVSGGDVRYDSNGNASIVGEASAFKVGSTNNGTAADNAIRVGANTRGLSYEATRGLLACLDSVERIQIRTNGTTEITSGVGANTPVFRLTNTTGDIQIFVGGTNPEGVLTASPGDLLLDATNGRLYLKRTGTGNTGWVQIDRCESGTYTPTVTVITNLDSATVLGLFRYSRIGDVVYVDGTVTVDPTAASAITFDVSLPIASAFAAASNVSGIVGSQALVGYAFANATDDRARCVSENNLTVSYEVRVTFSYVVL